jgi:competence ComEA-like helix-hairpin-helix protein
VTDQQERGLVLLVCVGLLVGGIVLLWPRSRYGSTAWTHPIRVAGVVVVVPKFVAAGKVNVNTADAAELKRLPGIGDVLAARIIAYRSEHGPFRTLDDLVSVKGIGPSTLSKFRELATVTDDSQ